MKHLLVVLTTAILSSNAGLLLTRTFNQNARLDFIKSNKIFAENSSEQNKADFIREIVNYINETLRVVVIQYELLLNNFEDWMRVDTQDTIKSFLNEKFPNVLNKIKLEYKFSDFACPKELSHYEIQPAALKVIVGVKSIAEEEIVWSDVLSVKGAFLSLISRPQYENIVISSRYNGEGFSEGIVHNNILYFVNNNRVFSYIQEEFNNQGPNVKLALQIQNRIITNGVIYNEKIYFAADDYYVYEYNPIDNQVNKIFKANNLIRSNGIVVNDNLYFGSHYYNLYQYDGKTNITRIVLSAAGAIEHVGTVLNDKLYFGTENGIIYIYDSNLNSFETWDSTLTVSDAGVIVNGFIYFTGFRKGENIIFKIDPKTNNIKKFVFKNVRNISSVISLNDRIFVLVDSEKPALYEFNGQYLEFVMQTSDSYFFSQNCFKGIVYDNAIYLKHMHNIIKFDVEQSKMEKVYQGKPKPWAASDFNTCGIIVNDKIYYGTREYGIFEYNLKGNS